MLQATRTLFTKATAIEGAAAGPEPIRFLYEKLKVKLEDINHLNGIAGLISWDESVMMPKKAAQSRASQSAVLAAVTHEKASSLDLGRLIDALKSHPEKDSSDLNDYEKANIRLAERSFKEKTLFPSSFVERRARLQSTAMHTWVEAREQSDFQKFVPALKDWIELCQEQAEMIIKGGINTEASRLYNLNKGTKSGYYQALMDSYEPGFKDSRLQVLFGDLKKDLIPLIAKIRAKKFQHDDSFLREKFQVKEQIKMNHRLAKDLGFDTDAGRLDVSVHPFTGGAHPTDVRMTTRYTLTDVKEGITGTIHESGHSFLEQGRNPEYYNTPVSEALSLGIHESQSLLWERMVGLSRPFWQWCLPVFQSHFKEPHHQNLQAATAEDIYKAFNRVEPGLIRVEADEVTYPLHVILRYEIEKGLVEGEIQVEEVPQIWNTKMKEYLGVDVPSDKMGCLQDTHWAVGLIGYFPTYTLGSIYAVQIFRQAQKDLPSLEEDMKKGNFKPLKEYLNKNIHRKGSLPTSGDELIQQLTGKQLDSSLYIRYLTEKYTELYDL